MTTKAPIDLELRPATIDDVEMVTDLETARTPDDPRDPAMQRFWWTLSIKDEVFTRMLAERDGAAIAYLSAGHASWEGTPTRFATIRLVLHPDAWAPMHYEKLLATAEAWVRAEEGHVGVVRVREDRKNEISVLKTAGYREVRRMRPSELDLVANRERILAGTESARMRMARQGVRLLTLDRDADPNGLTNIYQMANMAKDDIPTTVPR